MITATLAALAFVVSSLSLAPEERVVRLSLEFRTADGVELDDLPVWGTTIRGMWRGVTDAQGRFEASIRVGKDERVVVVWPAPLFLPGPKENMGDRAKRQSRLNERYEQYAFSARYEVAVEGETAASTIIVHPAGRAIVRFRDADGKDVESVSWTHQQPLRIMAPRPDGVAEITGLPIPGPTSVWITADRQALFFDVTCPNQDVVDLGVVDLPAVSERRKVRVRLLGSPVFDRRYETDGAGITMLRLDPDAEKPRSEAWGWGWGWELSTDGGPAPGGPKDVYGYTGVALPGRYIVAPTAVGMTRMGDRILEAWRAGEDLHAKWGLPVVEVTAEGPNEFEVRPEPIYKAVMGEMPPTIDLNANALVSPAPTPAPTPAPAPTTPPVPK